MIHIEMTKKANYSGHFSACLEPGFVDAEAPALIPGGY